MDILKNAESIKKFLDICEAGDPLKDFYDEDDLARALITLIKSSPSTSLSKIISQLEYNESIKFTSYPAGVRIVIKKGDHPKNNKTVSVAAIRSDIEKCNTDVIAIEVERALIVIRSAS